MQDEVEITIDGISYRVSELSAEAQAQVANLQFVDTQMAQLQAQLAVYQTARNSYEHALHLLIPRTRQ
ncbi:MAG: hypothetical protein ACEQSK_02415 [Sphingomonadaceae bacterium]